MRRGSPCLAPARCLARASTRLSVVRAPPLVAGVRPRIGPEKLPPQPGWPAHVAAESAVARPTPVAGPRAEPPDGRVQCDIAQTVDRVGVVLNARGVKP